VNNLQQVEILLVEDNPQDAEMTLRSLKKHNLFNNVHWVKDGAEALDFMFCEGAYSSRDPNHTLKLVLLDIKMPKVDGIEVLRRLKADTRTRATPVVIMTSSNEERDVVESYKLGVNSYIVKPVQFESFLDTVSKIGLYWVLANRVPAAPAPAGEGPA
jgi:two-component system response regulator